MRGAPITAAALLWALWALNTPVGAQLSDYELAENFKQSYRNLTETAASATGTAQIDAVAEEARELRSRYEAHEKLLDEALYPQTFASMFQRLETDLISRRRRAAEREESIVREKTLAGKLQQKTRENESLQRELDRMNREVIRLSEESDALRSRILALKGQLKIEKDAVADLKAKNSMNQESILKLNQLVENLNAGLASRDRLVTELKERMKARDAVVATMGQKLMEGFAKPQLTPADIQTLSIGTGENDYFETVLKTIEENIRFIESTFLNPGDLEFSRGELLQFSDMWDAVGPKLSAAYPSGSEPSADLTKIASALNQWQRTIEDASWKNINDVFSQNDFKVGSFSSGDEFRDRLIAFVRAEKDARGRDNFERFNNRVWSTEIKPLWIPYLLAKGDLDDPRLADMEAAITDWGKSSAALYWALGLTLLLVISAASLWAAKRK